MVVTRDGKAVEGAVVLVGKQVRQDAGSLLAQHGAISDAGGRFNVDVTSRTAQWLLAMHHEIGWSAAQAVATGTDDATVQLRIAEPGSIEGRVTRGSEAEEASLNLPSADESMSLSLTSDSEGNYRYPMLPPGVYTLRASLSAPIAGGATKSLTADVSVTSGETSKQDIELPVGVLLAVNVDLAEGLDVGMLEYTLVRGEHLLADAAALAALIQTSAGRDRRAMSVGGIHKQHVMQFHDLRAGNVTVCVTAKKDAARAVGFRCGTAELDDGGSVQELTIDIAP